MSRSPRRQSSSVSRGVSRGALAEINLMDAAHAFLFGEKFHDGRKRPSLTIAVQQKLRAKLRTAERFVLDGDAVRLVCRLSHEMDRLEAWSLLARLPYDCVWFEFDIETKLREFEAMNALASPVNVDLISRTVGYLLFREEPGSSSARWICHEFNLARDGEVMPGMFAYVFDPEGDMRFPVRGSSFWRAPTLSLIPGFPKLPVKVVAPNATVEIQCDPEIAIGGIFTPAQELSARRTAGDSDFVCDDADAVAGPGWLTPRMAVILEPWWTTSFGEKLKAERDKVFPIFLSQVGECRGHLRWIIALLGAVNGLPKTAAPAAVRTSRRSIGMHQLPHFQHRTLSITVPREDRLARARKALDRLARDRHRAWHKVSGHWRVIERGKRKYMCRHIPALVENGLAICEKCGLMVRWINAFERGDATVGVVEHTYVVKT